MKKFMRIKAPILFFLIFISLASCDEGVGTEDPQEEPPIQNETPPAKVVGTLPVNGEPCSDYEEVADDFKVSVLFNWNSAQFADSYVLTILEESNQVFGGSFNTLSANVELDRGKTYSWSITSVNEFGQTNGDTYFFTTPGTPIGNFAPYTAEISVAFDESASEMSISWVGSDEDGDVLAFDIEVFEQGELVFDASDLSTSEIEPIAYLSDTDYLIEVVSKDEFGNFSIAQSEVTAPN